MNRRFLLIVICLVMAIGAIPWAVEQSQAAPFLNPAVDLSKPNFAYSPPLRKFMDSLPGYADLTRTNGLGQCIPLATAGVLAGHPGDDYYEIALVEYREQLHRDLPAVTGTWPNQTGGTKLRGYVQLVQGTTNFVTPPHYLGPLIIATKDKPVRIKFVNMLPTGAGGKLFLPVDTTIMGAGEGPLIRQRNSLRPGNPGLRQLHATTAPPSISMAVFLRGSATVPRTSGSPLPGKRPPILRAQASRTYPICRYRPRVRRPFTGPTSRAAG